MKTLYIVRGLPGSGKSTLAKTLVVDQNLHHHEADKFFIDANGDYIFDVTKIGSAHQWCKKGVLDNMVAGVQKISVSNTFTMRKEIKPYLDLCETYGYTPFIIHCQNEFGNIHNVPEETLKNMKERFQQ